MLIEPQPEGFYYCDSSTYRSFIIQMDRLTQDGQVIIAKHGICPAAKSYYQNGAIIVKNNYTFTEATTAQMKHLMKCAKLGRFIGASRANDIVETYSIF